MQEKQTHKAKHYTPEHRIDKLTAHRDKTYIMWYVKMNSCGDGNSFVMIK